MKVTDKTLIEQQMRDYSEVQDGLIITVAQGKKMLDLCVYMGKGTELFELTIIDRREGDEDENFMSYSFMKNANLDSFNLETRVFEYYSTRESAHARIAELIWLENHF